MSELSELGQVLHEEHFHILVAICDLENRISGSAGELALDPDNADDQRMLDGLIASLDQVIVHHAFEEWVIFPLLRGGGEGELAMLLTRDHGTIEPKARRLRRLAAQLIDHTPGAAEWARFRAAARELVAEMMRHLEKEEQTVVQRLPLFLDADTDHELAVRRSAERSQAAGTAGNRDRRPDDRRSDVVAARNARVAGVSAAARLAARRRATSLPVPSRSGV